MLPEKEKTAAVQEEQPEMPRKILVVDDAKLQRKLLSEILHSEGYEVIEAENGQKAVEQVKESTPDLVLMDVEMPVMDGISATRTIRQISKKRHLPIIFVTVKDNPRHLHLCLEAGGDDFITKPVNPFSLKARIKSQFKVNDFIDSQISQKKEIEAFSNAMAREQEVAAEIFKKIVHEGGLAHPAIKYLLSPMSLFNGDLLLAERTPSGQLQVLLGDFTGHGLVASIGAGPAAEIFYGMTAKGFGVEEIIPEINKKMCKVLPTGMFLAACMLSFNSEQKLLTGYTGGLPDHLLFDKSNGDITRIASSNLPLGIVENDQVDFNFERFAVTEQHRLYLFTDGLIEARDEKGNQSGVDGVVWCLRHPTIGGDYFNSVLESYRRFVGEDLQEDDITFVELNFDPKLQKEETRKEVRVTKPPMPWQVSMLLEADSLKSGNPVPVLINQLIELQGLLPYRESIYTVVTELYVNALDHGLLGLDSNIKISPEGFMRYFQLRDERLSELKGGQIKFSFRNIPIDSGGRLEIMVRDSGEGFDFDALNSGLECSESYSGRGLSLVKQLCASLDYSDGGRCAKAVFEWSSN